MDWIKIIQTPFVAKALNSLIFIIFGVGIQSVIVRKNTAKKEMDATARNTVFLIIFGGKRSAALSRIRDLY